MAGEVVSYPVVVTLDGDPDASSVLHDEAIEDDVIGLDREASHNSLRSGAQDEPVRLFAGGLDHDVLRIVAGLDADVVAGARHVDRLLNRAHGVIGRPGAGVAAGCGHVQGARGKIEVFDPLAAGFHPCVGAALSSRAADAALSSRAAGAALPSRTAGPPLSAAPQWGLRIVDAASTTGRHAGIRVGPSTAFFLAAA